MAINAIEALRTYKCKKEQLAMIESQLEYLEKPKIKAKVITDDIPGPRTSLEEQYERLMLKKDRLRVKWLAVRSEVAAIEKALELMQQYMPIETNALKMRYLECKSVEYVAEQLGFCDRQIMRKAKKGCEELERLLNEAFE